jgi:chemotaxis protein CheD
MKYVIAVGDMKCGGEEDVLVTYALGSCLGLMIYDPVAKVGGLLHAMLPLSKINPEKAKANPFMFVDTGVPELFKAVYNKGGEKRRLIIKAAGCGNPIGNSEMFKIGDRNFTVLKKILWKNNVLLTGEDTGGTNARTVNFDLASGQTTLSSKGRKWEL